MCAKPSTPDVPSDSDLIDYISVVPGDTFPLGDTRVTCVVNDGLGQVISKSFTVTVRDSTPPTLNVPTSVIVNATDPSGAGVSYVVTATDLVTSADLITITCHPTSGATFASGTTSVSCTAVDQAGNVSPASTFPVTVLGAAAQLRDLRAIVVAMTMPLPTKVSLLIVVDGARLALALNKPSVACGLLSTFSAQVRAQSGQRLTLAQADRSWRALQESTCAELLVTTTANNARGMACPCAGARRSISVVRWLPGLPTRGAHGPCMSRRQFSYSRTQRRSRL